MNNRVLKKILMLVSVILFMSKFLLASGISWMHRIGGANDEFAYEIHQTTDGGYILVGDTNSTGAGERDVLIIKLDYAGNILWQKVYGGKYTDWGKSIQQTSDGGYIITGRAYDFAAAGADILVMKLDSVGGIEWQKVYNPNIGWFSMENGRYISEIPGGGYIITAYGQYSNFYWVARIDSAGTILWQKAYNRTVYAGPECIKPTSDGGFIVVGHAQESGGWKGWIIKLDGSGTVQWQHSYSLSSNSNDMPWYVEQLPDNNFIIVGSTTLQSNWGTWVFKIDQNGNVLSSKVLQTGADSGFSIKQTADGGFIVGSARSFGGGYSQFWVAKLDSSLNIIWQKTSDPANSYAYSVGLTSDGGYIAAGDGGLGASGHDISVKKFDSDGNIEDCVQNTNYPSIDAPVTVGTPSYTETIPNTSVVNISITTADANLTNTTECSCLYPVSMNTNAIDNNPMLDTGVDISWQQPTDWNDNGYNSSGRGFRVYRDGVDISGFLPSSTTFFNDNSGINNVNYTYYVEAINGCGLSVAYSSQIAMDAVGNPGEASKSGYPMLVSKGSNGTITINYTSANCATSHNVYWGVSSGTMNGYNWTDVYCDCGNTGSCTFTISDPPSNSFYYIVIVGNNGDVEGSYGKNSAGVERPEASGIGTCDFPQNLNNSCD